jgi:hypothetical protein
MQYIIKFYELGMFIMKYRICLIVLIALYPKIALAYIGPGMSGGIFFAAIGIIIALFASIFALLWFPIKKMFARFKNKKKPDNKDQLK